MGRREIQWLHEELPGLVRRDVIDASAADRLREHYGPPPEKILTAFTVSSIFGAVLIGLGVILLSAHNWYELSRATRTALAFAPLLAGLCLAGYTLFRRMESMAWREGVGAFVVIAVGACLALVSQIYQINGDLHGFMWGWLLLAWPVMYVLGGNVAAVLYWIGVFTWTTSGTWYWRDTSTELGTFAFLIALAAPYLALLWKAGPVRRSTAFVWSVALLSFIFSLLWHVTHIHRDLADGAVLVVMILLFAAMGLAGDLWQHDAPARWRRPLVWMGRVGLLVCCVIASYDVWESVPWLLEEKWSGLLGTNALQWLALAATILLVNTALGVWAWLQHERDPLSLLRGAAGPVFLLAYILTGLGGEIIPMSIANLFLLGWGLLATVVGIRREDGAILNGGLLVLSVLILARFVDADLSILLRGIAFTFSGVAFLSANIWLHRRDRKKEVAS